MSYPKLIQKYSQSTCRQLCFYPKLYKSTPKVIPKYSPPTLVPPKIIQKYSPSTRRQRWLYPKLYKSTPKVLLTRLPKSWFCPKLQSCAMTPKHKFSIIFAVMTMGQGGRCTYGNYKITGPAARPLALPPAGRRVGPSEKRPGTSSYR